MNDKKFILSEKPEDLLRAVELEHEQQRKILNEKGEQLAEALMEKMTPLILQQNIQKQ